MLKVFGCLCYPFIRPYNKNKLQYRLVQYVFVGYSTAHKGYLCLDYKICRIYVTRHVVFDENSFPMKSTATQSVAVVQHIVETPAIIDIPKDKSTIPSSKIPTPTAIIRDVQKSEVVPSLEPLLASQSSLVSQPVPQSTPPISIPKTKKMSLTLSIASLKRNNSL